MTAVVEFGVPRTPGLRVSPSRRGSSEGSPPANPSSKILMYYPFLDVSRWSLRSAYLSARSKRLTTGDGDGGGG